MRAPRRPDSGPGVFLLLRRLRAPLILLIVVYAIAVIGMTLVPGKDPTGAPWRMDFLHAFYFISFLGTTIGLGEIPYPFSPAQRLWVTFSIYSTVIAWLYGIGELLATLQDPLFRRIAHEGRFRRAVARIREPFVIVCGYGDAGSQITRELTEDGIRCVVIDKESERAQVVEVDDLAMNVPALHAAAMEPDVLLMAGVRSRHCIATLALTGDDAVNLAVTLNAGLLAPERQTVCVAHHHAHQAAMARVGASHIINPSDTFATRLADAITRPSLHVIYESLTTQSQTPASDPPALPRGRWIVCGNGRFAKAVRRQLGFIGLDVVTVADPGHSGPGEPEVIVGGLLDAATLRTAGIEQADGIVITVADDTHALAITMLARELQPRIFTVVRQSQQRNTPLFEALGPDLATLSGYVVAAEVLRILRAPLLSYFLSLARHQDEVWAAALLARLRERIGDNVLDSWTVRLDPQEAPAVIRLSASGVALRAGELLRSPADRDRPLEAVPLLLQRRRGKILLPGDDELLEPGDQLLLCGRPEARSQLRWTVQDPSALASLCQPAGGSVSASQTVAPGAAHG